MYIKRKIQLDKIECITYSTTSNNFLIHIPSEYDYFLYSEEWDEFISLLLLLIEKKGIWSIWFYFVEDT